MKNVVKDITPQIISLFKELINIPSLSGDEKAITDYLEEYMTSKGIQVGRKGNNIWSLSPMFDLNKPTLLLHTHLDTVSPGKGWRYKPFEAKEVNNKIYGLGANNSKSSLAILLHLFFIISEKSQSYNTIFLATGSKEDYKNSTEEIIKELPTIDLAIVGEPTNMQAAIGQKGIMILDATASFNTNGFIKKSNENIIYQVINDINWLQKETFEKKSSTHGGVTMEVIEIASNTNHFNIPNRCSFSVKVRTNEHYKNEQLFELMKQHMKSKITLREGLLCKDAVALSPEDPLVIDMKKRGKSLIYLTKEFSNQLLYKRAITIGPGKSSRHNKADEYITIEEMEEAIGGYLELLTQATLF